MNILKRLSIVFMLCLISISFTAFASVPNQMDLANADVILETSNPEIGVALFIEDSIDIKSYNTKIRTGSGYFYKTSDNSRIAKFNCTGEFSYDGSICNVLDVSTSVWETIDGYAVDVSQSVKQISPTYARATGVFELTNLDSDKVTSAATINVFCNQDGDTSVEFNGD